MNAPPLPSGRVRHRLAEAILAALHEPAARARLATLARDATAAAEWLGPDEGHESAAVLDRARRASAAMAATPLHCPARALDTALEAAALLFDAELFFEVHEVLEPHWRASSGETREAIQGLIQIAVGYQHQANGNPTGARSLLAEGVTRVRGRRLHGLSLDDFAASVVATCDRSGTTSSADLIVPAFPRARQESP